MRQRYFWVFLAVLVMLFSGLMIVFSGSHTMAAQALTLRQLDTPTPTPRRECDPADSSAGR